MSIDTLIVDLTLGRQAWSLVNTCQSRPPQRWVSCSN